MPEIQIRPYQPSDRADLLRIGAETAFFGTSVENYLEDRRLFCDLFYAYYTDVESQYCWIAVVDGRVAGFLTGCIEERKRLGRWMKSILPGFFRRLVGGGYHFGPLTWQYGRALLAASLRGEMPHLDLQKYPAHLHINVEAAWRGHGLGQRLMDAYLLQLRSLGVRGVHLMTTNRNEVACRLYEKMGFRLLEARPTRLWERFIDQTVENRAYGMVL
jgi:ribosomal protein S18 acetylase RimI-like enzyme